MRSTGEQGSPGAQPRRILLMGGVETRFHHFDEVAPALAKILLNAGYDVTSLLAPDALRPEVLPHFDALVSITTGGELDPSQESALLAAAAEPRNDRAQPLHFLGVHGASCSFANSTRYAAMLGGRFLRHPPIASFEVVPENTDHPVTRGIEPFTIYDEQYVLELCSEVELLLHSASLEPPAHPSALPTRLPLGWARRHGLGKVCYLALGHGPAELEHPSLVKLVTQALAWFVREDTK